MILKTAARAYRRRDEPYESLRGSRLCRAGGSPISLAFDEDTVRGGQDRGT